MQFTSQDYFIMQDAEISEMQVTFQYEVWKMFFIVSVKLEWEVFEFRVF